MDFFNTIIFTISIHFSLIYTFLKITHYTKLTILKSLVLICASSIIITFQIMFELPLVFKMLLICFIYSILLGKMSKITFENSFIVTVISLSISLITIVISSVLFTFFVFIFKLPYTHYALFIAISLLHITLVSRLFKFRRFKNGFPFLINKAENPLLTTFILIVTTITIFTYFLAAGFTNIRVRYLLFGIIIFAIIIVVIIQKNFILYHKQKLQTQALKDYEHELEETKQKLATAIEEKEKLVKSNHEFYHRQEALKKKLDDLIKQPDLSMNSEYGEDYGNIQDRINKLTDEYIAKTKVLPVLPKTHITEIDDMLTYMQSECDKNNIEFILKINCDINHILENFITQSQLETLLGDLIRNAIIAINHTSNSFKSIMVMFGIKNDSYELCIYDSGIPFEISTLVNLGLKPASTHESEGGTGIGFITTFETINSCNASFIISEITNNNYTKSLEIKFDNKNEYIIISERRDEIKKANLSNRNIIIKG